MATDATMAIMIADTIGRTVTINRPTLIPMGTATGEIIGVTTAAIGNR